MDKNIKIIIFFILFLGGLYFYINYNNTKEGLTTLNGENRCPNLLIQKGVKFFLYNSNIAEVPGVNPIEFNNLEEYIEFLEWQRGAGIICPVLYLQNTYDTQGNSVYKVRPGPTDLQGGLPPTIPTLPNPTKLIDATQSDMPYNINSVPAHDQTSFYQGTTTPLDQMNIEPRQIASQVRTDLLDDPWPAPTRTFFVAAEAPATRS